MVEGFWKFWTFTHALDIWALNCLFKWLSLVDLDIVKPNIKVIYSLVTQCQVSASGPKVG